MRQSFWSTMPSPSDTTRRSPAGPSVMLVDVDGDGEVAEIDLLLVAGADEVGEAEVRHLPVELAAQVARQQDADVAGEVLAQLRLVPVVTVEVGDVEVVGAFDAPCRSSDSRSLRGNGTTTRRRPGRTTDRRRSNRAHSRRGCRRGRSTWRIIARARYRCPPLETSTRRGPSDGRYSVGVRPRIRGRGSSCSSSNMPATLKKSCSVTMPTSWRSTTTRALDAERAHQLGRPQR